MAQGSRKAKIIRLLQILFEETDRGWNSDPDGRGRGLTMPQIIERLEDYGISAERKGLYDDIKVLKGCGFEIEELQTRPVQYAFASHPFEDEQVGVLIDSVQSSLALTETRTDKLIDAILSLIPEYKREPMRERSSACAIAKVGNGSLIYSIDGIKRALTEKKKIRFNYCQYNLKKELVCNPDKEDPSKDRVYVENPIRLAYVNDRYYLITYNDKYDGFTHYRVDRMSDVEVLDDAPRTRNEKIANFDAVQHLSRTVNMFSGDEEVDADLLVDEIGLRQVIDRFGLDVRTSSRLVPDQSHWVHVYVTVGLSDPLYGWLCGLGEHVKVEGPSRLVNGYRAHLKKVQDECLPHNQASTLDSESL